MSGQLLLLYFIFLLLLLLPTPPGPGRIRSLRHKRDAIVRVDVLALPPHVHHSLDVPHLLLARLHLRLHLRRLRKRLPHQHLKLLLHPGRLRLRRRPLHLHRPRQPRGRGRLLLPRRRQRRLRLRIRGAPLRKRRLARCCGGGGRGLLLRNLLGQGSVGVAQGLDAVRVVAAAALELLREEVRELQAHELVLRLHLRVHQALSLYNLLPLRQRASLVGQHALVDQSRPQRLTLPLRLHLDDQTMDEQVPVVVPDLLARKLHHQRVRRLEAVLQRVLPGVAATPGEAAHQARPQRVLAPAHLALRQVLQRCEVVCARCRRRRRCRRSLRRLRCRKRRRRRRGRR
eukprot:Rhum_TRINITY_DN14748_c22_g1::Rhum_TRINITY_DN14748_c22_g1_i1::g.114787::m.114787